MARYRMSVVVILALACDSMPPGEDDSLAELADEVWQLAMVRGFEPFPNPPPVRGDLVELGRMLAFDKILSGNRNIACMTCHLPGKATGDGKPLSVGEGGEGLGPDRVHPDGVFIPRNSPAVLNLPSKSRRVFWDGRVEEMSDGTVTTPAGDQLTAAMMTAFEFGAMSAQGLFPVTSRAEMRGEPGDNALADLDDSDFQGMWAALMARLGTIPEYVRLFETAYPGTGFADMTFAHASNAIAGFYASEFVFNDTPWDRFLRGDLTALSGDGLAGAKAFMTLGCANCHNRSDFGGDFHNTGLPQYGPGKIDGREDLGRENITGFPSDRRRFMVRVLRNVELTAPYGHLGQFPTLEAFVGHYNDAARQLRAYDITTHVAEPLLWPTLLDNADEILTTLDPLLLDFEFEDETLNHLVAFLKSLTDDGARDLTHTIPDRVPSGLSVDRLR